MGFELIGGIIADLVALYIKYGASVGLHVVQTLSLLISQSFIQFIPHLCLSYHEQKMRLFMLPFI